MRTAVANVAMDKGAEERLPSVRFDLEWIHYADVHQWVAHDPISGSFFRFSELEYQAASLLDGKRTLAELLDELKKRFAFVGIDVKWLVGFLHRMRASCLLQSISPNAIRSSRRNEKYSGFWQVVVSPLSIRIPLFNPRRLLEWLYWPAYALLHPRFICIALLVAAIAGVMVLQSALSRGLPSISPESITADRWLLLMVCYVVVKSLHEIGHMLACSRYGVRSTELGVLLLCMMPCFYCDTTDAWRLPSRRQRIAISAAGMYVELLIATIASFVWLGTNHGTLNLVSFDVMLVCSISTLLINGNPFLRYDGYYILSDLWGVPNLHEQARLALNQMFNRFVLFRPRLAIHLDGHPLLLGLFSILSSLYRLFVFVAILWLCWTYLPSLGLEIVALAVSISMVAGIVVVQKRNLSRSVSSFQRASWIGRIWTLFILGSVVALLAVVFFLPLPRYVTVRAYIDYEDKIPLYSNYDAKLEYAADKTRRVEAGSLLIKLNSSSLELERVENQGKVQRIENELEQLRLRRAFDETADYIIPRRMEELDKLKSRAKVLDQEVESLETFAPSSGWLIDANVSVPTPLSDAQDERFVSTTLDQENSSSWIKRSQQIAWFSSGEQTIVIAIVPEYALKEIRTGLKATVKLDSDVFDPVEATVTRVAPDTLQQVPDVMLGDESLVSIPNVKGYFETETPHSEVVLSLESKDRRLFGAPATVTIKLDAVPVYQQLWDFIRRAFKAAQGSY